MSLNDSGDESIFYRKNKTPKEAREFYEAFLRRFGPRVEEIEIDGKKLKRLVFEKWVNAWRFVFPKVPNVPIEYVDKNGNRWGEVFSFKYAVFKNGASFENALFEDDIWFDCSIFKGNIGFVESDFLGVASFGYTVFEDEADFWGANFNKEAWFVAAIFKEDAYFEECTFNRVAEFVGDEDFMDNTWRKQHGGYKFHGKLSFSNVDFRKGIIIDMPSEWFKFPEAEIEARRVQRLSYEKEGKREEADRMFVLERRAYRRVLKNRAKEKYSTATTPYQKFEAILFLIYAYISTAVETVLADWVSLYGTSWGRIILSSLWVITVNAILYFTLSQFSGVTLWGIPIGTIYSEGTSKGVLGFLNALYYSLVTFTTLGYGDMHPTGWLKALSAIEALRGAVFMALIVAVIARKWMR